VLKSIDKLKELLECSEESDNYDISENLSELKQSLSKKDVMDEKEEVELDTTETSLKLDKYTFSALRKQGKRVYHIKFELRESSKDNFSNPLEFFKEIEKTGEIVARCVDMELVLRGDAFSGEGIPLDIIYASVLEKDLIAYIFGVKEELVVELKDLPESPPEDAVAEIEVAEADIPEQTVSNPPAEKIEVAEVEEYEEEFEEDIDVVRDKNEYLTFLVEDEEYGIGITQVHEIVTMQEITRLPSAEDFVRGIINLRGDIIPVYDFRLKLKWEARDYDSETIILIAMIQEKKVGIIVDRVSEVITFNRDEITDAPQMQQIPSEYVIGIGQKDEKFIVLLKVSAIFDIDTPPALV
ncbi:MAG: hypothetical protein GY765_20115, partial [bacterium]|nr:hypothetical protein [bacterium]